MGTSERRKQAPATARPAPFPGAERARATVSAGSAGSRASRIPPGSPRIRSPQGRQSGRPDASCATGRSGDNSRLAATKPAASPFWKTSSFSSTAHDRVNSPPRAAPLNTLVTQQSFSGLSLAEDLGNQNVSLRAFSPMGRMVSPTSLTGFEEETIPSGAAQIFSPFWRPPSAAGSPVASTRAYESQEKPMKDYLDHNASFGPTGVTVGSEPLQESWNKVMQSLSAPLPQGKQLSPRKDNSVVRSSLFWRPPYVATAVCDAARTLSYDKPVYHL